jgi:phage baseplate assembly protein W
MSGLIKVGNVQKVVSPKRPYFVGFNTVDNPLPPYSLTNISLIKRDILNHFATPIGSRLMMPEFGTRIYEYLFDPFDEYTKNAIIEDASNVVNSDPRVELISIAVFQEDQALNVVMDLLFKPESVTDNLYVVFSLKDRESN